MSQGGPPPVSFKTNVNRMKTKRWVEAKQYNYDGDEWGDADEYDEYGDYNEPQPSKPTGLRPAGQAAGQASRAAPSAPDQSWGIEADPVTSPPQPSYGRPQHERQNSFGRGDDQQNWGRPSAPGSGPPSRSHSPIVSPLRTAYGQTHPVEQPSSQSRGSTPVSARGQPLSGSRAPVTTNNPSHDLPNRRNVASPPVAPQPPYAQPQRPSSSGSSNPPSAAPRDQSDSSGKTLPFIRPAEIYKRMQEEKERQRQSQESSRASLDVAAIEKSRDPSPGKSGDESDGSRARKPTLDTLSERQGEIGSDGLLSPTKVAALNQTRRESGSPQLPEIGGFGDDFASDFGASFLGAQSGSARTTAQARQVGQHGPSPASASASQKQEQTPNLPASVSPAAVPQPKPDEPGTLQHASSQGFRSAVQQAFDQPAGPDTPSSASGSQVARSNSETTSVISPIISRGPSDAQYPRHIDTEMREPQISTIAEEPSPRKTPVDRGRPMETEEIAPTFIPGYRREAQAPSPDNSPARKATLGSAQGVIGNPQEVKLASGTQRSVDSNNSVEELKSPVHVEATQAAATMEQKGSSQPSSRAGSPTKGRVRDLAEKIESGPSSRRGSQDSATGEKATQRPQSGRLESFRPVLPGGWNSYTTNPTPGTDTAPENTSRKEIAEDSPIAATASAPQATTEVSSGQSQQTMVHPEASTTAGATHGQPNEPPSTQNQMHLDALPVEGTTSSIMHTPQGMGDGHDLSKDAEYFSKIPPLNTKPAGQAQAEASGATGTPTRIPNMSTESSPSDQESDRLRKQLVRELSPQHETAPPLEPRVQKAPTDASLVSGASGSQITSAGVPSEYERYWTNSTHDNTKALHEGQEADSIRPVAEITSSSGLASPTTPSQKPPVQAPVVSQDAVRETPVQPHKEPRRFSWEASSEQLGQELDDQTIANPSNEFQGVFQSDQADHVAEGLFSPTSQVKPSITEKSLPPQPPAGEDYMHEDVNLLNLPHQADFIAANDPMQASIPASAMNGPAVHVQAFREVQALQSTEERLKGYALARMNLLKQEEGLESWLLTSEQNGEHPPQPPKSGLTPHRPSPSFQMSAASSPLAPGGSVTNLGASPSSAKLSSQQVQAKGKDLLHSAGVFGGKANVAAKGLLAKGRNKFRNAGGDKAPNKPSATRSETSREHRRVPFKFGSFSSSAAASPQRNVPDKSRLSLTSTPPSASPLNAPRDLQASPSPRDVPSPLTPIQPLVFSKRHALAPPGFPPGTPPAPSPMEASRPSISSMGNEISSGPSSLSGRENDVGSAEVEPDATPFSPWPQEVSREEVASVTQNIERDDERLSTKAIPLTAGESTMSVKSADPKADSEAEQESANSMLSVEESTSETKATPESAPRLKGRAVLEGATRSEIKTNVRENTNPARVASSTQDSPLDSKGEETPTQENFPPNQVPEIKADLVDKSEKVHKTHIVHISQQAIMPSGGPVSPSQRSSLALGEYESQRFILQTPAPDPDFTLMPLLDFDTDGQLKKLPTEAEPKVEPELEPETPVPSMSKPALLAPESLTLESAIRPAEKQNMSIALGVRPFSFIDFDKTTPRDIELTFQLTPLKEPEEPEYDHRQSLASVDEESEEPSGILNEKNLEEAPPGTPLSARRPRSALPDEPDIGDHPAFRGGAERTNSPNGASFRNEGPVSPALPSPHAHNSRATSVVGNINSSTLQAPLSPKPSSRPTDSLFSRPSREANLAPSMDEKKKKKRRSLLSSLSGQSDRSKRRSSNLENSLPIDPQPNIYLSYQASAFQQRKLTIGSDEQLSNEPQRSLSRQLLQRLPGLPGPLGKTPETSEPKAERGPRKRRFSGLGGFISRTVRPRQNSRSGPPPVNTFAHIRSTSQASYSDPNTQRHYEPGAAGYGEPAPLHQRQQSYATQLSLGQNSQRSGSNSSLNRPTTSHSHRGPTYSPFPQQWSASKANPSMLPPQANVIASREGSTTSSPKPDARARPMARSDASANSERQPRSVNKHLPPLQSSPVPQKPNHPASEQESSQENTRSGVLQPREDEETSVLRSNSRKEQSSRQDASSLALRENRNGHESTSNGKLRGGASRSPENGSGTIQGTGVAPVTSADGSNRMNRRNPEDAARRGLASRAKNETTIRGHNGMGEATGPMVPDYFSQEAPRPIRTAYAKEQQLDIPMASPDRSKSKNSFTTTTATTTTTTTRSRSKSKPAADGQSRQGQDYSTSAEQRPVSTAAENISQAFSLAVAYPGAPPEATQYMPSPNAMKRLSGQLERTRSKRKSSKRGGSPSVRPSEREGGSPVVRSSSTQDEAANSNARPAHSATVPSNSREGEMSAFRSGPRKERSPAALSSSRREGTSPAASDPRSEQSAAIRSSSRGGDDSPLRTGSKHKTEDQEASLAGRTSDKRDRVPAMQAAARDAKRAELPRIKTQQLPPKGSKGAAAAALKKEEVLPPDSESPKIRAAEVRRTGSKAREVKAIDVRRTASEAKASKSKRETSKVKSSDPKSADSKSLAKSSPNTPIVAATRTPQSAVDSPATVRSLPMPTTTATPQSPEEARRAARRAAIEQSGIIESEARAGAGKEVVASSASPRSAKGKRRKASGPVVDGEVIPMNATAYPGQEWRPDFIAWEG